MTLKNLNHACKAWVQDIGHFKCFSQFLLHGHFCAIQNLFLRVRSNALHSSLLLPKFADNSYVDTYGLTFF